MKKTILSIVMAALCLNFRAQAQNIVHITGRVIDSASNQPLPAATIKIKSTRSSTSTNKQGNFTISTNNKQGVVVVSFLSYRPIELKFSENNLGPFIVALNQDQTTLKEISVVSTGYQTIPKERATGSFVQVDSALLNRRISTDILSRLEGVVPGLIFNRNTLNSSNGNLDLSIHGHSTLFSNDQPLIILDNFPYDGDINNINPNDVASITVLKDAAAASIWGVRSGNGVIVITTKKGKTNQKLNIEFNSNLTIGNKPNIKYNLNFLDANDFINVEQTLFKAGYYNNDLTLGYPVISPVVQLLADVQNGSLSATAANDQINALRNVDVRDAIEQYFYRKSVDQQYDLNFRGGGDKSDYYLSLGYDNDLSNLVGDANNRITINTNYNLYPFKGLQLSVGVNYTKTTGENNNTVAGITPTGMSNIYPYAQLADANGKPLAIPKNYSQSFVNGPANAPFLDWNYRPLDELKNADNTSSGFDNRINLGIKYTFLKGFSTEFKYVYENSQTNISDYFNQNTYYTRNLINTYTQQNADGSLTYPIPIGGILQESNGVLISNHLRGQLNYTKDWDKNSLVVLLGSEISSAVNTSTGEAPAYGYDQNTEASSSTIDYLDYFGFNPRGTGIAQIPNGQYYQKLTDHYLSYFSNAAYTYDDKYTISASGRIDESNLFGVNTNQKAVPLYSAGLLWDVSKEEFYHIDWLPQLKMRTTFGYNGNVNKTATAIATIIQQGNSLYNGMPYANIANPGNPNLEWEKDRMINLGLDFDFKNQIISGSIEAYFKKGINLFGNAALPPSTGYQTFFGNTASTSGNGIDLTLNSHNIYHEKFKWLTTFLYSHAVDKVTKYNAQATTSDYLTDGSGNGGTITPLVGAPIFGVYSYRSGPLTHNTGDPQGYLNGQLSTDYADILKDTPVNGLIYNGPSRPTSYGSLRNTFIYNEWSLSFNVIYKLGYVFRRSSISYEGLYNSWLGNKDFDKRWQKPGDELKTTVPSMPLPPVDDNRDFFYTFSQTLVDNGDNVRLEDISLNYDLTRLLWKRSPFTHLTIYAYVNNVGILWRANHDGLDPDVYSAPGTTALPLPRTYSLGLKSNFK